MNSLFILVLLISCSFSAVAAKNGCSISINQDLSEPQPLILNQNNAQNSSSAFRLPVDSDGTLTFLKNETFDLACPGSFLHLNNKNTYSNLLEGRCTDGKQFIVYDEIVSFQKITCKKVPYHVARYSGRKCGFNNDEIEIGFNVNNRFIKHIVSCFDKVKHHVLYSISALTSTIAGFQHSYPRPKFIEGNFYNVAPDSISNLFSRKSQQQTINGILGLSPGNTSVIHTNSDYFLSTGHYTPKADFVYGAQQWTTFYYVNTAPQWQTFNGGNWNTLEKDVRNLAARGKLDLVIITGSYGVTTLPDVNGIEQPLYLWKGQNNQKGIPVPEIFFKVVYDSRSKLGVAFFGVNNPYKKDISYTICKDVCKQIKWVSWKQNDMKLGYSYCCEVNDFRKVVSYLPTFEVNGLLKSSGTFIVQTSILQIFLLSKLVMRL